MTDRNTSIELQTCIKAAAVYAQGRSVSDALEFVETMWEVIHSKLGVDASNPLISSNAVPMQEAHVNVIPDSLTGCPKCGSKVIDYREKKKDWGNPAYPDFKCSSKTCDWVNWVEQKQGA